MSHAYYVFIMILLFLKIAYLVSVAYLHYVEDEDHANPKIPLLEANR